jgi:hypothetical protein
MGKVEGVVREKARVERVVVMGEEAKVTEESAQELVEEAVGMVVAVEGNMHQGASKSPYKVHCKHRDL